MLFGVERSGLLSDPLQADHPLEPYLLIGESGKSPERTVRDLAGRLFMRGFEILGKYSPPGDPDRMVLVVTHPHLLRAIGGGDPSTLPAAAIRIAVTVEDGLTYVSFQEPRYWVRAYLGTDYHRAAAGVEKFRRSLLAAMPPMRGSFHRPFGGRPDKPLTPDQIEHFQYNRRAETRDDFVLLAEFDSQAEAAAVVDRNIADSEHLAKVFELSVPGSDAILVGISLLGPGGDRDILALLDHGKWQRTACLPLEVLIAGGQVRVYHTGFRLALAFPDMDRKTFRSLRTAHEAILRQLQLLVR